MEKKNNKITIRITEQQMSMLITVSMGLNKTKSSLMRQIMVEKLNNLSEEAKLKNQ